MKSDETSIQKKTNTLQKKTNMQFYAYISHTLKI